MAHNWLSDPVCEHENEDLCQAVKVTMNDRWLQQNYYRKPMTTHTIVAIDWQFLLVLDILKWVNQSEASE